MNNYKINKNNQIKGGNILKRFFILVSMMIIGAFSLSADYDSIGYFGENDPVPYHYYGEI